MANVNLKTDFRDGEKLFGQQLNNNFAVIKAALEAMNRIAWQDDPNDSVTAFRGTTEQINQRDIIDGQLLYDTSTGETYIDVGSQRISTGSGNAIHIGSNTPTNPATQLWVDPNEPLQLIGTEVVNSMDGTESNKAPSVQAIKNYIDNIYSTDEVKTNKIWIDNKPIYRKMLRRETVTEGTYTMMPTGIPFETIGEITEMKVLCKQNNSNTWFAAPTNMSSSEVFGYYLTGTNVVVKSGWELEKITVVLEYTKADATSGGDN